MRSALDYQPIVKNLENCPDPKAQLVFELIGSKIDNKEGKARAESDNSNRVSVEKESPTIKSIRSPSFGSNLSFTPKKFENMTENNTEERVEIFNVESQENRGSFGKTVNRKEDIEEKYFESQLTIQRNMEKYDEVIQMNIDLKKEKDEVD